MTEPTIRAVLEQQFAVHKLRLAANVQATDKHTGKPLDGDVYLLTLDDIEAAYQLGQQAERERCALLVAGHITDSCPKDCAACALARDMARQIINASLSNMTDAAWVAALRTPEEPAK